MPITPIDLATVAPKSQETFIAKQPEVQKPMTDHANANVQTEQKVQKQSDTVIMEDSNVGAGYVSWASKQNLKTPSPKPATMLGV